MSEAKWYIAANHNHASYNGAGCPVVFSDESRRFVETPLRGARSIVVETVTGIAGLGRSLRGVLPGTGTMRTRERLS